MYIELHLHNLEKMCMRPCWNADIPLYVDCAVQRWFELEQHEICNIICRLTSFWFWKLHRTLSATEKCQHISKSNMKYTWSSSLFISKNNCVTFKVKFCKSNVRFGKSLRPAYNINLIQIVKYKKIWGLLFSLLSGKNSKTLFFKDMV